MVKVIASATKEPLDEKNKKFLVSCGWCGKQHPVPLKEVNILAYICNTKCTFCGKLLAKLEIAEE
jgi:hypothetical protein